MGCGISKVGIDLQESNQNQDDVKMKKMSKYGIGTSIKNDSKKEDNIDLNKGDQQNKRLGRQSTKKFKDFIDQNVEVFENIGRIDQIKSANNIKQIKKAFSNHFVFFNLSDEWAEVIIEEMFYSSLRINEYIFKQGDEGTCFFIIEKGEVEVIINEKSVRTMKEGECFGELSLLYNVPRSATIKTLTNCYFWTLQEQVFKKTIEEMVAIEYDENRKFIDQVNFFSFMTQDQRDAIGHALITTRYLPGEPIVCEGDRADSYYVIKSGYVDIIKGGKSVRKMGPKESFGEQALYVSSVRMASVYADTEVKCLVLGRDNLTRILGDKVQLIIFNNLIKWSFEKSPYLQLLTKLQLEKFAQNTKINNYKANAKIYSKGEICHKIVIILEGTLTNGEDNYVKGFCFGDQYILKEKRDQLLPSDYFMQNDGVLAVLNMSQVFKLLGGDFEIVIEQNEYSHEKKIQNLPQRISCSQIRLEDIIYIKNLGQGSLGQAYLVKDKSDQKNDYVLKCISKKLILQQNLEKGVIQEKQVLEMINFPFIVQYFSTYKDDFQIYFLTEYINGLELFDVIRDIGLLGKYDTQFYIGTIILCIEYLHGRGIVHRDIKPENLMVDHEGYLYMMDFGTAKYLQRQKNQRTYTIIGTSHYMAPEIILGKGYSYSVDLWSVGVCMYELICGGFPYAEDEDDPYQIYEEIMNTPLTFPNFVKDRIAKRFIEQLLQKQPESRLGGGFASLKANIWFDDFDWDKLFDKKLEPPYIPNPNHLVSKIEIQKTFSYQLPIQQEIKQSQVSKLKIKRNNKFTNWEKDF